MKKESKAERMVRIYREYGIDYNLETEKLYCPGFGWTYKPLVDGNGKIGKGIYHFSTLPGKKSYHLNINVVAGKVDNDNPQWIDIDGTCVCTCEGCYAMAGNYNYSNTLAYLAHRTIVARLYTSWLENAINAQIKAENIKFIRIHASGDFFNNKYVKMWQRIAIANPQVTMWTYTKNAQAENAFNDIANVNIVKSMIPGKGFNFGHCNYILACYEYLKNAGKTVYICRCGIDKNQHCTNCKGCSKNEFVLFIEHSTSYKAERDPLFPVLKQLIESQEMPQ